MQGLGQPMGSMGWSSFDGLPSPGRDDGQAQPLSTSASPSRIGLEDRNSPIVMGDKGQLRPIGPPGLAGSRQPDNSWMNQQFRGRQHPQQKQGLAPMPGFPMNPNGIVLEPGGGLTNPGPGPFGRGPSPLEGNLGQGPSPPNGFPRDVVSPQPRLEELAEKLAGTHLDAQALQQFPPNIIPQPRPGPSPQLFSNSEYATMGGPLSQLDQVQQAQVQAQQMRLQQQLQPDLPPKGYKTVICKFWENNMCAKGSSCTFAHGQEELQRFSGGTGAGAPISPLKLDRYKTKLCLFHMQGRCCKGPNCPYAHGLEELRPGPGMPANPAALMMSSNIPKMADLDQLGVQPQLALQNLSVRPELQTQLQPQPQPQQQQLGVLGTQPQFGLDEPSFLGPVGHEEQTSDGGLPPMGQKSDINDDEDIDSAQQKAAFIYFQQTQQQVMNAMMQQSGLNPQNINQTQHGVDPRQVMMAQKSLGMGVNQPGLPGNGMGLNVWPHGPGAWSGEEL